ncbi:MAG: hypothetical protein PHQ52_00080 [Candidatus Omnitrophica bacterium]|nr:hypothetical protein [Candidatus Omnitrophota bacterium]
MVKKYVSPTMKAVELEPKQAIIQVCVIGGVYMRNVPLAPICFPAGTDMTGICSVSVKGQETGSVSLSPVGELPGS